MAALTPGVLASRVPATALRPGMHLRVATSVPAGPELAALLGLELMGIEPVPAFGLHDAALSLRALQGYVVDAVFLTGPSVAALLAEAAAAGAAPLFTLGVPAEGGMQRDPLLPLLPTVPELVAALRGGPPGGALAGAWRAAAAAAQMEFTLVLPPLTPAALVAPWRRAGAEAQPGAAAPHAGRAAARRAGGECRHGRGRRRSGRGAGTAALAGGAVQLDTVLRRNLAVVQLSASIPGACYPPDGRRRRSSGDRTMNNGISPLASVQGADPSIQAGLRAGASRAETVPAEPAGVQAPPFPNPSLRIDGALGLVVLEFHDRLRAGRLQHSLGAPTGCVSALGRAGGIPNRRARHGRGRAANSRRPRPGPAAGHADRRERHRPKRCRPKRYWRDRDRQQAARRVGADRLTQRDRSARTEAAARTKAAHKQKAARAVRNGPGGGSVGGLAQAVSLRSDQAGSGRRPGAGAFACNSACACDWAWARSPSIMSRCTSISGCSGRPCSIAWVA